MPVGSYRMRNLWAKMIVLPILSRWDRRVLWMVKWPIDDAVTECRWFKKKDNAEEYAAFLGQPAIVVRMSYDGDHPTLTDDPGLIRREP
jgi:hypothetical protein